MFLKYFIELLKRFSKGFKAEIVKLFIMSVLGGFLELLGIAAIFPVILILVSEDKPETKMVIDCFNNLFPYLSDKISPMGIAFVLSLFMIGIFVFKNIFMMIYTRRQNVFVKKWADYVNEKVIKKLLFASYKSVKNISYGDKNTLLFSIVRDISLDFVLRCIILLANAVVALSIVALLFYKFTIPAFLSCIFILTFAYFENDYFKKKARYLGDIGVELVNKFALDVNFIIQSQKEIIISNKQEYFADYLMKSSKDISDNFSERISFGNYPLFVTEIGVILSFLIMIISIVFANEVSRAEIISSLAVITLIVLRLVPQLNKVLISMYTINVSKQKVIWFLEKFEEISKLNYQNFSNGEKIKFENEIELKDVSFAYEDTSCLNNINLKIKKGEFIGIIGASGAGKTTLADIISGIYVQDSGKIYVDGQEINSNNLLGWQKNISFLSQETVFLNDLVLKNVAWGLEEDEIDIERAKQALVAAGLDGELIYQNSDLSFGQKQRCALARAYYKDFELLILDEPTSSLDVETENEVISNILKLKGKKTIIAIAHRLSTIKNCDRIIYLNEGQIKDAGTFDELRQKYVEIDNMLKMSSFEQL